VIRCKKCGTVNEADAAFCGGCDAFLQWSGERIDAEGEVVSTAPGSPPPPSLTPNQPPAARPREAPPPAATTSAASAPTPTSAEPRSRKPEKGSVTPERKAKPVQPTLVEKPKPGELVCQSCGTGNDPARQFCRRCGAPTAGAPVEVGPPPKGPSWFSRVLRRGKQEAYVAGQRPESMLTAGRRWRPGSTAMVFGLLGLVGLGSVASYLYVPEVSDTVDDIMRAVENRIGGRGPANTVGAEAHFEPGFPAQNMIDGFTNTYWLGPRSANGRWLIDFELQDVADLVQINIHGGADGEAYQQLGRPREIQLRADNGQESRVILLDDDAAQQPIEIDLAGAQVVRLIVHSQYVGDAGGTDIAIREVAFVERQ
jgi:uncharacterized OB-fold protein